MTINMPAQSDATKEDAGCCGADGPALDADRAAELAERLTALADPVRLQILSMIANASAGEVCACDFVGPIGKSQPTISHHLKVLAAARLVETERRGRWIWYRLAPDALDDTASALVAAIG